MGTTKAPWPQDHVNELPQLVKDGLSCSEIAAVIHNKFAVEYSRSAVAGRVSRLRRKLNDDTFRVGLSVGRRAGSGAQWNGYKALTNGERAARSRARWTEWEKHNGTKNPGSVISALKSRLKDRKAEAYAMMRNHIVCAPDACHFTEHPDFGSHFHTHCCWPVYADDAPYSELNSCCNRVEPGKPYCAAHQRLSTEYVAAPFKQLPNRKGAVTIVPHHWKRDSWRAA